MEIEDRSLYKKGLWTAEEDMILLNYVGIHGKGHWNRVAKNTELKRCGKSCRLRWMNYLSPNVRRDRFSEQEEDLIIRLHKLIGNRWSLIAKRVPGRTDNQVKNYWNTHLRKKLINANQQQPNGIAVSSLTKSREPETASISDNGTFSGNVFVDEFGTQKSDEDIIVSEEAVMKEDDDVNPVWIIDDGVEMSELMMELDWYSCVLA